MENKQHRFVEIIVRTFILDGRKERNLEGNISRMARKGENADC